MSNTRPPGPETGLKIEGCYAALLADCQGDLEAEHFVSRTVLEQLGKRFTVTGPAWAGGGKRSSPSAFKSHVLCGRHNRALSPVDATAGRFYGLILRAANGEAIGSHTLDGEDLERWAMKLILGAATSGNLSSADGKKLEVGEAPIEWLRILFGERPISVNCGFRFVADQIQGMEAPMNLAWQIVPGPENSIAGVSLKVAGCFQFITTVTVPLDESPGHMTYRRPGGFVLGVPRELGHIKLTWPETQFPGSLILRFRPQAGDYASVVRSQIPSRRDPSDIRRSAGTAVDALDSGTVATRLHELLSNAQLTTRDRHDIEAWLELLTNMHTPESKR